MKKIVNLKGTQLLDKRTQKEIIGGKSNVLTGGGKCSNSICASIDPRRCCGYDDKGNYGCVIALPGSRNCR
ncbi:hypothetical protein [uncultured Tenacibaculum sp.]|uniref:hypothetical protein n=1 Tax=uncultured Tenacibaculum sp. TaxID=174713 RepID=UPI00261D9C93|nr:hypothetical protein [uncultured Tenacibaculum sp.]